MEYDADRAPDPEAWLAEEEQARLAAVAEHHRALGAPHPRSRKPRLHAAVHLVVENQLALGDPPEARRALERLVRGGLSRHEAVHAVGLLVANAMSAAVEGQRFDARAYARELDLLTAERWRALAADEG
jgi:hypothetical protein